MKPSNVLPTQAPMSSPNEHSHRILQLNVTHRGIALCLLFVQILRTSPLMLIKTPVCDTIILSLMVMEMTHLNKTPSKFCASLHSTVRLGKWHNLLASHFCHLNEWHLYHNLTGLLRHAIWFERQIGWRSMCYISANLLFRSQIFHLLLNHLFYVLTKDEAYARDCYIGISGLVFAINVLSNLSTKGHWILCSPFGSRICIQKSWVAWLDLFLIQFPLPTSSFLGHAAGIIAGISYQSTFFERYGPICFDAEELL